MVCVSSFAGREGGSTTGDQSLRCSLRWGWPFSARTSYGRRCSTGSLLLLSCGEWYCVEVTVVSFARVLGVRGVRGVCLFVGFGHRYSGR